MKLFKIQGDWSGAVHPVITNIKLKSTGMYAFENVEFEVFNVDGINKDNPPILNDLNHRWGFIVTSEGIPKSTNEAYHGTLTTNNMKAIVTYTGETGEPKTCEASLTVKDAVYAKVRYEPGHHGARYQVYPYAAHAVFLTLKASVSSNPEYIPRVGSRLLAYTVWDSYDEATDTYSEGGIIKNEVDLDPYIGTDSEVRQYIEIPDTAARATIYTLSYNINEADVLSDILPANDYEVRQKVKLWDSSDVKYLKLVYDNEIDAIWSSIQYSKNPIDPYRIGSTTGTWKEFVAMANFTGPSYSYSDAVNDSYTYYDPAVWDAATLVKVFSGPKCVAAITSDNSVITMGYSDGGIRSSIAANPFPAGLEKIAIGYTHAVGLLSNGTVVNRGNFYSDTWQNGSNTWTDIVDVIAGNKWTVGVKADGSLVGVSSTANNSPIVSGQFTNVIAKKIYLIDEYNFAIIDDTGKIHISGTSGGSQSVQEMRTAAASWPDLMSHIVCNRYRMYAFCNNPSYEKQLWCTSQYGEAEVAGWHRIVAATLCPTGIVAIRCDGQILSSTNGAGSVKKPSNDPVLWSADRSIPRK